jgi:hypothetical protein
MVAKDLGCIPSDSVPHTNTLHQTASYVLVAPLRVENS